MVGKNVAKAKSTAMAEMESFDKLAGQGLETVTSSDLLIPRLVILQKLSPQINKKEVNFIENAVEGEIADTALGMTYDKIHFCPVVYRKNWIEWAPRKSGKGIVAIHDSLPPGLTKNDKGVPITPEGNTVVETAQFFGFLLDNGSPQECFVSLYSTQLRKAKQMIHMMTTEEIERADGTKFTPPIFYRTYSMGAKEESNNEGSWFGWVVARSLTMTEWCVANKYPVDDFFKRATKFHKIIAEQGTESSVRKGMDENEAPGTVNEEAM